MTEKCEAVVGAEGHRRQCEMDMATTNDGHLVCMHHYAVPPMLYIDSEPPPPAFPENDGPLAKPEPPPPKKKSTRRSISVKGMTYQRLQTYCDAKGRPVSGLLEEMIAQYLDERGAPLALQLAPRKPPAMPEKPSTGEFQGSHFTW